MAITPLNVDKFLKENKFLGPVTSPEIFTGGRTTYHLDGLFSERFFDIEGSLGFKTKYSWIELKTHVIHPFFYDIIKKRIERKIVTLISGEKTYSFDNNGYLVEDPYGELSGLSSLYKNIEKLRFRKSESTTEEEEEEEGEIIAPLRNKLIDVMHKAIKDGLFFIDKLIVIPPFFRPVSVLSSGEVSVDPLNEIYRRVIILANQIERSSGLIYDILSYRMQLLLSELLDFCKTKLAKKTGLIRSLMLGKRVDFSARAVISPNPNIGFGYVGIPLRQVCQLFEPFILYGLMNSPYANRIPEEFHIAVKQFLGREKAINIEEQ